MKIHFVGIACVLVAARLVTGCANWNIPAAVALPRSSLPDPPGMPGLPAGTSAGAITPVRLQIEELHELRRVTPGPRLPGTPAACTGDAACRPSDDYGPPLAVPLCRSTEHGDTCEVGMAPGWYLIGVYDQGGDEPLRDFWLGVGNRPFTAEVTTPDFGLEVVGWSLLGPGIVMTLTGIIILGVGDGDFGLVVGLPNLLPGLAMLGGAIACLVQADDGEVVLRE